jgi:hypothetical protein
MQGQAALKCGIILSEIWSKPRFYPKLSSSITEYGVDAFGIVWALGAFALFK